MVLFSAPDTYTSVSVMVIGLHKGARQQVATHVFRDRTRGKVDGLTEFVETRLELRCLAKPLFAYCSTAVLPLGELFTTRGSGDR